MHISSSNYYDVIFLADVIFPSCIVKLTIENIVCTSTKYDGLMLYVMLG